MPRRLRWRGVLLTAMLLLGGAQVLADETVTLTTFYPQQPILTQTLAVNTACGVGAFANVTNVVVPQGGRLLIMWTLDVFTGAVTPVAVQGRVRVNGIPQGGATNTVLDPASGVLVDTLAGHALLFIAAAAGSTIALECACSAGPVTANAGNTTLMVMGLR